MILINSGKSDDVEHNKFWLGTLSEDGLTVITQWGRLGTKGQSKSYTYGTKRESERFLNGKCHDKMNDGYHVVQEPEFKRLQRAAAVIGSKNKVTGVLWVEVLSGHEPRCKEVPEHRLGSPECLPGMRVKFNIPDNHSDHYLLVMMSGDSLEARYSTTPLGPFGSLPADDDIKVMSSKILESIEKIGL